MNMNSRDLVYLQMNGTPVVGEIVGFTPKRVRVAVRNGRSYSLVLRAKSNLEVAKKARMLG